MVTDVAVIVQIELNDNSDQDYSLYCEINEGQNGCGLNSKTFLLARIQGAPP